MVNISPIIKLEKLNNQYLAIEDTSKEDYICESSLINKTGNFNFDIFYYNYNLLYPNYKLPSKSFLQWLIGFTEGDGCFVISKRYDISFVITQSYKDINILNYIKNNLNIGNIVIQSNKNKTYRFIIRSKQDIYLICLLFNGNIVLPTKNIRFIQFITILNEYILKYKYIHEGGYLDNKYNHIYKYIKPNNKCILPTLNDYWLSGFTDAKGCFTCSILSNKSQATNENTIFSIKHKSENNIKENINIQNIVKFKIRFILSQKWDINKYVLNHILYLFNELSNKSIGLVTPHSNDNNWELRINGIKNCIIIQKYFDKYPLLSNKKLSYNKFINILYKLKDKQHLNSKYINDIKLLAKDINK